MPSGRDSRLPDCEVLLGATSCIGESPPTACEVFVRRNVLIVAGLLLPFAAATLPAQQRPAATKVKVSTVLTAFLVDSGIRTTALPWSTGSALPIRWATPGPVAVSDARLIKAGITQAREGRFLGTLGDSVALWMQVTLRGSAAGLTGMSIALDSMEVTGPRGKGGFSLTREMIEQALVHEGLTFQPLKCKRETEGASYGNLVDAVKAPGKTASGLWWEWHLESQRLMVSMSLLYRRAEMAQVECYTG